MADDPSQEWLYEYVFGALQEAWPEIQQFARDNGTHNMNYQACIIAPEKPVTENSLFYTIRLWDEVRQAKKPIPKAVDDCVEKITRLMRDYVKENKILRKYVLPCTLENGGPVRSHAVARESGHFTLVSKLASLPELVDRVFENCGGADVVSRWQGLGWTR